MNLRKLVLFFLVLICSACAAMKAQNQIDKFELSLRQYSSALRWGHWSEAYSYHISKDKKQPEMLIENLERFSVASFTVLDRNISPEGDEAIIVVNIKYYDEQIGTLRNIKQQQVWWYNTEVKRWLTESDFPEFK